MVKYAGTTSGPLQGAARANAGPGTPYPKDGVADTCSAARMCIGMGQIMFETDYPHGDSTFPHSRDTAATIASKAGLSEQETWRLLRGNAISCYRLDRYGITH
jgi:predicted TIM-barrel fold metal-dependent hydrolase